MPMPLFVPGQVLNASDVNTWLQPVTIIKTTNTSRSSNISVTADPELSLPLAASSTFQVEALILYDGAQQSSNQANPGGMSGNFSIPASATGRETIGYHSAGSAAFSVIAWTSTFAGDTTTISAGGTRTIRIRGVLTTVGSSGSLVFNWAQTVSSTTATTVYANSYIMAQRIG